MNKFLLKTFNKTGILPKVNTTGNLFLNNRKFIIPITKGNGYNNLFMSELWMIPLLRTLLEKVGSEKKFIDIGVNIGQTLLKLRSVSADINYSGFEPNPTCVNYVNELININTNINSANTELYPVGLSESTQILALNLFSDNAMDSAASLIEARGDKVKRKIFVPIFNALDIDAKTDTFKNIGIVKIDVEGVELEVLNSLSEILMRERPLILIEILPVYDSKNTKRYEKQQKIEALFSGINYTIHRIIRNNSGQFSHLEKIQNIGIHSNLEYCDYTIIPDENNSYSSIIKTK